MTKASWIFLIAVVLLSVIGAYWYQTTRPAAVPQEGAGIANPASVNCIDLGGSLEIVSEANGAVGYCHLKDGRVCEEWSLMRGGCAVPGESAAQ